MFSDLWVVSDSGACQYERETLNQKGSPAIRTVGKGPLCLSPRLSRGAGRRMSARIYRAPDQAVRHDFRGSSLRERRSKNPCRFEASVEALYLDKHLSRPTAAGFCLSLCDFLVREAANRWGGSTSQLCTQQNSKLDGTWHKQFPHGCSASFSRWRFGLPGRPSSLYHGETKTPATLSSTRERAA